MVKLPRERRLVSWDSMEKQEPKSKKKRIKELTELLITYCEAYYKYDNPIVSDKEYDILFDELRQDLIQKILESVKNPEHKKLVEQLPLFQDFPARIFLHYPYLGQFFLHYSYTKNRFSE